MIINGKKISFELQKKIQREVAKFSRPLTLVVFSAGKNAANDSYIQRKKVFAESVGILLHHVKLPTTSTAAAKKVLVKILKRKKPDAAILQIPVAKKLNADALIDAIPAELDVDALGNGKKYFLSPVVLSVQNILRNNHISVSSKNVVVVGAGRLVGRPVASYFLNKKAKVTVCDEFTKDISTSTKKADIIVSGAGASHIITPAMVKKNVVALDVGFSIKNGKIVGDIDPLVAKKALVFSPVPGGIGGMTVAYLFHNVVQAKKRQNKAKN